MRNKLSRLSVPYVIWMALFVVIPLFMIVFYAFTTADGSFTLKDGKDGDEIPGHIANIHDGTVIGFKYFDFDAVEKITLMVRGYGWGGTLHVKTEKFGPSLASMKLENTNIWTAFSAPISLPKGKSPLYITYEGGGSVMLKSVIFE